MKRKRNQARPARKRGRAGKKTRAARGNTKKNTSGPKKESKGKNSHPSGPPPSKNQMAEWLDRAGLKYNSTKLNRLWNYHRLLRQHNGECDFTPIRGFVNMVCELYLDALLVRQKIKVPSPLLNIDSGAGLPGLPIKIFTPSIHLVLAETVPQRIAFQRKIRKELELEEGWNLYNKPVETDYPYPVEAVITRQELPGDLLPKVAHFLPPGGWAIFLRDFNPTRGKKNWTKAGGDDYQLYHDEVFKLPPPGSLRRLLVFERIGDTPAEEVETPETARESGSEIETGTEKESPE